MANQSSGFWSSLPGILSGIAGIIAAITSLYLAMKDTPADPAPAPVPPATVIYQPAPVSQPPSTALQQPQAIAPEPSVSPSIAASTVSQLYVETIQCGLFASSGNAQSLLGLSHYYQQKIIDAQNNKLAAIRPCYKAINYRAEAYCLDTTNLTAKNALVETLQSCSVVGVSWQEAANQRP